VDVAFGHAKEAKMTTAATLRRPAFLFHLGLAVTALVTVAPLVDLFTVDSIAGHVRDAYPAWPAGSVAADRNAIAIYLAAVGVLGMAGWLWAIVLHVRGSRRTRLISTVLFVVGAVIALTDLSVGGESYDRIVPLSYGMAGLLPVLIGAVAVVELWRGRQNHYSRSRVEVDQR
jgi:hypothetical protein